MNQPVLFWGGIYSQWYQASFEIDGVRYPTAEHFMMVSKAVTFDDEATLAKILSTDNPAIAKKLGRQVAGWDEEKWKQVRFQFVCRGSYEKFRQNPDLLKQLIETGDREIVEASPYDKVWGVGMGEGEAQLHVDRCNDLQLPITWNGLNLLGKALMAARTMLTPQ